jgi:regulatory protein
VQEGASSSPNAKNYLPEKITDEDTAFRFASECQRAEKVALRLIARAEQCSLGLTRKLEKRNFSTDCVSAVISRLLELKLVNDSRFSRLWLESRLRLARSPRRLLVSLCGRGIDRDDAETAIKTILDEETEFKILTRFVKKYSRKQGRKEEKNSVSLKHMLRNEGFSQQVINQFLDDSKY